MKNTLRTITVATLAGLLVLASFGTALAATESAEPVTEHLDLETYQERVIARLEVRVDRMETALGEIEGTGPWATQLAALLEEGITIYTTAIADVQSATSIFGVREIVREANQEFAAHKRVRRLYAHVQTDIDRFGRRLGALERAIDRADEAGFETSRAVAQAEEAAADLDTAQALLDVIDPSLTGPEVLDDLAEAHRSAHAGRRHIRAGFAALLPPGPGSDPV